MIRITNFKRALLLFLVCCLVFNMATVPVDALGLVAADWIAVGATTVIASTLILLGIQRDSEQPAVFDNLVGNISLRLEKLGLVSDGLMSVLGYKKADGQTMYAVKQELVEAVLDAVCAEGVVTTGYRNSWELSAGSSFDVYWGRLSMPVDGTMYLFSANTTYWGLFFSTIPFSAITYSTLYSDSFGFDAPVYSVISIDGVDYYYSTFTFFHSDMISTFNCDYVRATPANIELLIRGEYDLAMELSLQQGLKEGDMIIIDLAKLQAVKEKLVADGKIVEAEDPESGKIYPYWPVILNDSYEEVANKSQADVWEGLSDYTSTVLDNWSSLRQSLQEFKFTFSSIKTILQNIWNLLSSIASAITAPIIEWLSPILDVLNELRTGQITLLDALRQILTEVFSPVLEPVQAVADAVTTISELFTTTTVVQGPLEALHFGAMLELFPFSIPYDLVQCINFWGASAEAPVLTIPLPTVQGGHAAVTTYDVNLGDLPGFNQIAAVIRAGELILFGIGLVLITRKVTKW